VELGSLVQSHFASWWETKKQAENLLASLRADLSKSTFDGAMKRGASLEVWQTIRSLMPARQEDAE
jgi:hypothetical protein